MNPQTLLWTLFLLPLLCACCIQLLLPKNNKIAAGLSLLAALLGLVVELLLLSQVVLTKSLPAVQAGVEWLKATANFSFELKLNYDPMAAKMMLVVCVIGLLVQLFSLGYLKGERSLARYYAGISLFTFAMTGIVLADNLFVTFMFWELVGLASYLLIGFWYEKDSAAAACNKAFITNRIGDFGFLLGILLALPLLGTLSFSKFAALPITQSPLLTVMVIALFCGAIGKSAQFPLHVWLPDAMEGPTPVSALIHAATMVAAGVYMIVRVQVSLGEENFPLLAQQVITAIGFITALLAAFMAVGQNDIKRILAYSTLSQLGLMTMGVGCLAGDASMFHLYTHAWFKALLFLGSGAIIYACHHQQDIWKMGGLARKMPLTWLCFAIGTMALIAVPGFSGFFSKEMILTAFKNQPFYYYGILAVSTLTTFYMLRLVLVVFFGKNRSQDAEHAHEVGFSMSAPLVILALMSVVAGYALFAEKLAPFNNFVHPGFHFNQEFFLSLGALVLGSLAAIVLYGKAAKDPLEGSALQRAMAERLYIDRAYDWVVKVAQDIAAAVVDFLDQFIIGTLIVGGFAKLGSFVGVLCRRIQSGNLSSYAAFIAVASLAVVYVMVFLK